MEIITTIIDFILLIGLISIPILIIWRLNKVNIKYKFIAYLTIGIVITAVITLTFAWWADTSDRMLLAHYGYNIDGMNETEFYGQVSPENMERVKSLERSMMGIGWPLKAYMTYVVYSPYILMVYFASQLIRKARKKNNT
jgi:hypothetical protein